MSVSAIIQEAGRVLMVQRKREPFRDTWMFPSGFVDYGEHPEDALAREVREETGLKVMSAELLGVFQSPDDYREPGHVVFFYRAVALGNTLRNDPDENESIAWFDIQSPPTVAWQLHRLFIERLQKGLLDTPKEPPREHD